MDKMAPCSDDQQYSKFLKIGDFSEGYYNIILYSESTSECCCQWGFNFLKIVDVVSGFHSDECSFSPSFVGRLPCSKDVSY